VQAARLPEGFRGARDIAAFGLAPQAHGDQSAPFRALLADAVRRDIPVVLPPGTYRVADIVAPDGLTIAGTPGATRLVSATGGPVLTGAGLARLILSGLTVTGAGPGTGTRKGGAANDGGLLELSDIADLTIEGCSVGGGTDGHGLLMTRCGGRIRDNALQGVGGVGLFAIDSSGLSITGNRLADCGNGGILVHRSQEGEDGSIVTGNRITRIAARDGGTGQNGNGINVFRAGNVIVSQNHISDCAFSAIRANAASNVLVTGNQALRSGETAIYCEFGFSGAIVSGNIVDTAANGILVVNFDTGGRLATVAQNVVRNITGVGPYVHDGAGFGFGISVEADTVVSGNVIDSVARWALVLGWGPYLRNVSVTGNMIRTAPIGCVVSVVDGAGAALIADNIFDRTGAAIVGYRWTEKATGDLMDEPQAGPVKAFPHVTLSGNRRTG
jgi:uncharacterized secreted repeat protein (TIGR03808 family)